jgi:hypothetical protein
MPPSKSEPPKPAPAAKPEAYRMPKPPAVVVWRHVPGGEPVNAVVTKVGRTAISVMLFPPDSRVGVPKEAVMHVSDPRVKTLVSPESGVWDYEESHKLLLAVARAVVPDPDGTAHILPKEAAALLAGLLK